jgi:hypothetical protein
VQRALDRIEQRPERGAHPAAFTAEFYNLRSHIQLVRNQLREPCGAMSPSVFHRVRRALPLPWRVCRAGARGLHVVLPEVPGDPLPLEQMRARIETRQRGRLH